MSMKGESWLVMLPSLLLLGINTRQDLKCREICLLTTMGMGVIGMLLQTVCWNKSISWCLEAALPGLFLLSTSVLSGQKVGMGDGLSVLVLGIWSGMGAAAIAMMAGLFFICIWNLIAVRREMADKGQEYPFLPFLTVGYLFWCAACLLLSVTHV